MAQQASYRYDVFISYAFADRAWVWQWLVPRLKAAGLSICIDRECFEPGAPVVDEIERAIRESRRILAVLSPAWVESEWAAFEGLLVQHGDPAARWRRLIPVLIEPCEPPERIQLLQWVDLTQADQREAQIDRIVQAILGVRDLPELRIDFFPEPRRRRWELRWFALAGITGLVTLILLAAWIVDQYRKPTSMPEGTYNVAVAEFDAVDVNEQPVKTKDATVYAMSIANYLQAEKDTMRHIMSQEVSVWGPDDGVRKVESGEEKKRFSDLKANILVYGTLRELPDGQWQLEPAFYLPPQTVQHAQELGGSYALGTPIKYQRGNMAKEGELNKTLQIRVKALSQLLMGLSYYALGTGQEYQKAAETFKEAADDPAWGAAQERSGQEILYLFLGNSLLKAAFFAEEDPAKRADLLGNSRQAYEKAKTLNDQYARSYNGLGSVLFQMAQPTALASDQCQWDWNLVDEAEKAYRQAEKAGIKPPSGYVDLRAKVGRARLLFWRGGCERPEAWDQAQDLYLQAVAEYETLPEEERAILADLASIAYTDLGHMALVRAQAVAEAGPLTDETAKRLLSDAVGYYTRVVELANNSKAEDMIILARRVMPFMLTAYCLEGQEEQARMALNEYVALRAVPPDTREAILSEIPPECIRDESP